MLAPPLEKFLLIQNFINGGAGVYFGNALLALRFVADADYQLSFTFSNFSQGHAVIW